MNAADLKAEVLAWLRYVRKQSIVCTEVGPYKADCWGLSQTRLIEIETKVTFADLRADLDKRKHHVFSRASHLYGVPNLFFFAVPPELKAAAQQFLVERADFEAVSKYGLLTIKKIEGYLGRQTEVVVAAQKLRQTPPGPEMVRAATLRMGSEVCGLHDINRRLKRAIKGPLEAQAAELANAARRMYSEADAFVDQQGEDDESVIPDP